MIGIIQIHKLILNLVKSMGLWVIGRMDFFLS